MTLAAFQKLVTENAEWFRGVYPESGDSLEAAQRALGCELPESMKWLLTQWGYSDACGIDPLFEVIETTTRCRQNCSIPARYLVLTDRGDAGVVWIDRGEIDANGESPVYWGASYNFLRLGTGEPLDADVDRFEDFPAWVQFRLEEVRELNS